MPHRLVYADGPDLTNVSAATHIGMGCRVCERLDCPSAPHHLSATRCGSTRT